MEIWGELSGVRGDFVRVSELQRWSFLGSEEDDDDDGSVEEDWSADDDGNEDRLLHLVVGESEDSWGATVVDRNDVDDGVVRWKASTDVRDEE